MRLHKIALAAAFVFVLASLIAHPAFAEGFIEYYFTPAKDQSSPGESSPAADYSEILEKLPEEIKNELPDDVLSGDPQTLSGAAADIVSFSYMWKRLVYVLRDALFPSVKAGVTVLGVLLLSAVLRAFQKSIGGGGGELSASVINAGTAVALVGTGMTAIAATETFRDFICGLMNSMVPLLGAVYAAGGSVGTGAVQSGGVLLLITLCQNLFAYLLLPSVKICLVLAAAGAVFPEIGVKSVSTALRNISTGIMLTAVTLFSFVLGLQNHIAEAADTFGAKSIKFAVGNLIPIIGGAVSDSVGAIGGSLSVLKSACGGVAIVIIILLVAPMVFTLLAHRLTVFLCKSAAGVLGCESEEGVLGEIGSVMSMLLAFAVAITVAFIFAMTLFCGSVLALGA